VYLLVSRPRIQDCGQIFMHGVHAANRVVFSLVREGMFRARLSETASSGRKFSLRRVFCIADRQQLMRYKVKAGNVGEGTDILADRRVEVHLRKLLSREPVPRCCSQSRRAKTLTDFSADRGTWLCNGKLQCIFFLVVVTLKCSRLANFWRFTTVSSLTDNWIGEHRPQPMLRIFIRV